MNAIPIRKKRPAIVRFCAVAMLVVLSSSYVSAQTVGTIKLDGFETPTLGAPNYPSGFTYIPALAGSPAASSPYWTFSGSTGRGIQRNGSGWTTALAPEGKQTAFLMGGNARMSQTVKLGKGVYSIRFSAARREYKGDQPNPIQVYGNGIKIGPPISPVGTTFQTYETTLFPFDSTVPTDAKIELASTDATANGERVTLIDYVEIVPHDTSVSTAVGAPMLAFTDLVTGPRLGNSDNSQQGQIANVDGAIVTVWGKNLGDRTNSTINVGGVSARVYYWGPATHGGGANLSSRQGMQMIEFQIPRNAPLGSTNITVTVNGVISNPLPFTTRDTGKIYFIGASQTANDSNPGTYSSPWKTFDANALTTVKPGDIVYLMNGFIASEGAQPDGGLLNLRSDGQANAPKAIVAYPGATATIRPASKVLASDYPKCSSDPNNQERCCTSNGRPLIGAYNFNTSTAFNDWVISKLRFVSPENCSQNNAVPVGPRFRVIGNYFSTPKTTDGCNSGTLTCGGGEDCGDNVSVLGNELTKIQTVNAPDHSNKLCHGIYISGRRGSRNVNGVIISGDQLEANRDVAWNYIHDNSNNRAINVYSEPGYDSTQAFITGNRVHDNWIENQSGIAILIGKDVVGENWLYNNVIVNAGLGPDQNTSGSVFSDVGSFFPLQIEVGSLYTSTDAASNTERDRTVLHAYNNLVYGRSNPSGALYGANGLMSYNAQVRPATNYPLPKLNFYNNIMISTVPPVPPQEPLHIPYLSVNSSKPNGKNNLWFGAGTPPAGEIASKNPSSIADLFINIAGGNFRLKTTGTVNPAKDAGITVPLSRDFDGNPRKQGTFVDIGPYEAP